MILTIKEILETYGDEMVRHLDSESDDEFDMGMSIQEPMSNEVPDENEQEQGVLNPLAAFALPARVPAVCQQLYVDSGNDDTLPLVHWSQEHRRRTLSFL